MVGPNWRLFAPFWTQKRVRFGFVFSSFLHTTGFNILCFQQIPEFVPTIFNIFSANPLLPHSWHPHFPVLASGRLLRRAPAPPGIPDPGTQTPKPDTGDLTGFSLWSGLLIGEGASSEGGTFIDKDYDIYSTLSSPKLVILLR